VFGLLDTAARRLVREPKERLATLLERPELIGLDPPKVLD